MRLLMLLRWPMTASSSRMCERRQTIKQASISMMHWLSRPDFSPLQEFDSFLYFRSSDAACFEKCLFIMPSMTSLAELIDETL
jgi:hypothetical protein